MRVFATTPRNLCQFSFSWAHLKDLNVLFPMSQRFSTSHISLIYFVSLTALCIFTAYLPTRWLCRQVIMIVGLIQPKHLIDCCHATLSVCSALSAYARPSGSRKLTPGLRPGVRADSDRQGILKCVSNGRRYDRKTLKSGCLSLLTIRSFGARDGLGLTVRVWFGGSVRAIDSLSNAV
eukprot:sb/3471816/